MYYEIYMTFSGHMVCKLGQGNTIGEAIAIAKLFTGMSTEIVQRNPLQ